MTHSAAHRYLKSSSDLSYQDDLPFAPSWWQRQSIRFKTTVLAIALGTIPTLAVGSIAYYFAASLWWLTCKIRLMFLWAIALMIFR